MADVTEEQEGKPFLPRWVWYAAIPGFAGPVLILGFIFVSELRHSEARCPFAPSSKQTVAPGVVVEEEARSCVADLEERRYTLRRGEQAHVLGRRRFASSAFGEGYHWRASMSTEGEVTVTVHNPGHDGASFREGTAKERAEVARP